MCGIAGLLSVNGSSSHLQKSTETMLRTLVHRGPDDQGLWLDATQGIALGHRRLSILDLSPLGHQPMQSQNQLFQIVFNGEIYNFRALRKKLEDENHHQFRGRSDTEVLLAAFEHWGVDKTLAEINGMFAIALWDNREKVLHLVRDRMGEKPLIYGLIGKELAFASEVRALQTLPDQSLKLDRESIALMLRFNNIPAPKTIFEGVFKLEPGKILSLTRSHIQNGILPEAKSYWSAREVFNAGWQEPRDISERDAIQQLDQLLLDSTEIRMESDVPVGAFLSGGVDSSLTVALMQAKSRSPVRTFTVGFEDPKYNEAGFAKKIANHLGTDHTDLHVTDAQVLDAVPKMAHVFDEPFSDSSQVPTYLISELTRKHVVVSLSGDGGDELFAGYNRYGSTLRMWNQFSKVPQVVRSGIGSMLTVPSPSMWTGAFGWLGKYWPAAGRGSALGFKVHKFAHMLQTHGLESLYAQMISQWLGSDAPIAGISALPQVFKNISLLPKDPDSIRRMMYLDSQNYLPDEILVKVDRAAMAVSLETRIPLLDHRIVEFSSKLPMSLLYRDGRGKYILRKLLERYVPIDLFDRPKMGFNAPIQFWLRGPLREWSENLLSEEKLKSGGYFDVATVRNKWKQHLQGYDCSWELWSVLMFQSWLEANPT